MRAIAAACCLFMGCLVTEKKDFPPQTFCPPSVETETLPNPMHPLDSIIVLDVTEGAGGDSGPANRELSFEVQIRDCNEDQDLQAKVFKSGDLDASFIIEPAFRDPYSFNVIFDDAAPSCQRIELVLSERFTFGTDRDPAVRDDDIGTATWWVAIVADGARVVDMTTECQ